jgi:hypothetical protein
MAQDRSDSPSVSTPPQLRRPATVRVVGSAERTILMLLTQVEAGRRLLVAATGFPPDHELSKRHVAFAMRTLIFAEAQMSKLNMFPSRLKLIRKEADLLQLEIDALPTEYRTYAGMARG